MKLITMYRRNHTVAAQVKVDDEDYEELSVVPWHLTSNGYAARKDGRSFKLMHREIARTPRDMEVDHLNGDKLDNRRENLVNMTPTDHRRHHRLIIRPNREACAKGCSFKAGRWQAYGYGTKQPYLGRFDTEEEAHAAYLAHRESCLEAT